MGLIRVRWCGGAAVEKRWEEGDEGECEEEEEGEELDERRGWRAVTARLSLVAGLCAIDTRLIKATRSKGEGLEERMNKQRDE